MRPVFLFVTAFIIAAVFALKSKAQVCTGSLGAPVVNETFGAGATHAPGPPLAPGITDLQYVASTCGGEDGEYSILSEMGATCKGGTWQSINHDHTGDKNGYMMIINASFTPSLFYTYKVSGSKLCPNTTYQFAAWIMNILRDLPVTQGDTQPDITFSIEKADGTVLKKYNTGIIPPSRYAGEWIQYGTFFTSPSDGSDIVVKMTNNGAGGNGNDLALDDITFSACGPLIQTGFTTINDTAARLDCVHDNLSYTLVAQQTGYTDPVYQWQQNKNDGSGWVNIPGETSLSLKVDLPNATAGKYQYRIGVLNKSSIGSEACRIYSAPLNINVYAPLPVTLSTAIGVCAGDPIQLSVSGGDSYLWSGPNHFSSTEDSPRVTDNAGASYDGVYTVRVTKNNCPSFASTTVKVYQKATVAPLNDVTICRGDAVPLHVKSTNTTHFKWSPADGLDHDDIADPIASPSKTTTYTVTVSNDGCTSFSPSTSLTVTVLQTPMANAGPSLKIFEGQTTKLQGKAQGDSISTYWTPANYLDDPSSLTPTTNSPDDITFTLHADSKVGCGQSTSSVFVRVYKKLTIVNSFTPNDDGINDFWEIKHIDNYRNADVSVFNRYGQKVFQNTGYSKPWDGTYNNKKLPAGTYYYIIDVKENNIPKQAGWVLLVR